VYGSGFSHTQTPTHNATTVIAPSIAAMLNCHGLDSVFCVSWPLSPMPPLYRLPARFPPFAKRVLPCPAPAQNSTLARTRPARLDAVVTALRQLPSTQLSNLPRMADFAVWATASETAFGWESGTFLAAYQENRQSANDVALDASTVPRPLLDLVEEQNGWCGTASELLVALEACVTDQVKRQKVWPKNPRSVSGHLKRLAPNLRAAGWQVTARRESKQRLIVIERAPQVASRPAIASPGDDAPPVKHDAKPRELFPDDADDGRDATAGPRQSPPEPNGEWEEGEL